MVACFEVFQTWDDEYEKLQVLLRDIVKRKREENLKMVWRINPAHRKLQGRLDQMRKFRRQHEQLRAVIVRVLRPQVIFLVIIRQKICVASSRVFTVALKSYQHRTNVTVSFTVCFQKQSSFEPLLIGLALILTYITYYMTMFMLIDTASPHIT